MEKEKEEINKFPNFNEVTEGILIDENKITEENKLEESNPNAIVSVKKVQPRLCDVAIDDVIYFEPATDCITLTQWPCSYLIITPKGKFCIDGPNLIKDAEAKGVIIISVLAEFWPYHSDYEIALKKYKLRNTSNNEPIFYIETMKHIAGLKTKRLAENSNLIQFGLGGARKNIDSSAKLNSVLAADTGLSLDTIGKYLADIKFVNDDAINKLIEFQKQPQDIVNLYPNKDFFEMIRPKKGRVLVDYDSQKLDSNTIEQKISDTLLDLYEKYRHKLPIGEFSDKQQQEDNTINSVIDLIKKQAFSTDESKNSGSTQASHTGSEEQKPGVSANTKDSSDSSHVAQTVFAEQKTKISANTNSLEDDIKSLAESLWKLADEGKDILEKREMFSKILNQLLLIVGSM